MATGATDMMLRCVFYGSLSVYNTESEWRPYHRNCRCALHKLKRACPNASFQQGSISFPINQLRNDFFLSIAISSSSQTSFLADSIVRPKEDTNAASSRGHKNYEVMLEWEASLLISYSSIPVNLWIKSGREELWTWSTIFLYILVSHVNIIQFLCLWQRGSWISYALCS